MITNLMLFFFPKLVLFVALAAEIRRLIWYRWQSTAKSWENTLKMKIFEKQNFQIWYECFKAKRIVVLFITISLLVGKQDESFVQVCWFQRLSLYVRIRLRFFFRKKWLKFIKVEIYKEASYEIYKCFVSLLKFFFEKKSRSIKEYWCSSYTWSIICVLI